MMADNTLGAGMKKITQDFYVDKSKELGKGNFGSVYKGYHLSTNRIIAVKFVEKKVLKNFPDYEREITVMHDLAKINHPNIMGYYGYEENEEGLYCFIEFCSGGSLKDIIKSKISEMKVLTLLKQLLDAMTYINGENKVHRDLKPDNILLDENQELKIADFGLARDVETKMTKGVCTPLYAAPQVLTLEPYNEKCDVWSAGLILFEMLTGKEMFSHVKKKSQLLKEVSSFAKVDHKIKMPKELHPEWEMIISRMMTHNPAKRPTFKEMKEVFEKIQQNIRNDLINKYGYETQGADEFESELRVTKSISPYQSKSKDKAKGNLADMAQRLQEERSFNNLNNLRKFLHFCRLKAELMVKLIKQFNSTPYACMKNVYKYILMFLSVSAYISRLEALNIQLKTKDIETPDGNINEKEILEGHRPEFFELIKEASNKIEASINKYKSVLEKQIIPKILGTYMQRPQQKKILEECEKLIDLIGIAKNGEYKAESAYITLFRKIISQPGVHFAINIVKELKPEDVKVYTYMRLIGHLDEALLKDYYKNDDYLRSKKQQFENASKEEHLDFIKKYN